MMKTHFLFSLLLVASLSVAHAQEAEPEAEVPQDPAAKARIDAARTAYITERLGLTAEESKQFWPIYNEFASKRQSLRKRLIEAKRDGRDEKELLELGHQLNQQQVDLERDYSRRILNVISADKLIDLRSAELEFRRIVIRQLKQRQQQIERQQLLRDRQQERLQQRNN